MYDYDLERYLTVRSAYGASLGPGGRLAFLLDTTGVGQVWTLEEPRGWPTQRTFYDEPVSFLSYSPERPELIFGMDEGGDERMQLYRLDDARVTPLTDRPGAKHRWGGWRPDGERFAFASNRRDESVFDVHIADRTGESELFFEGDGWLSVGGWSPDAGRLVLTEAHSSFDQDVYVLDVDAGERTHLTPHEGNVRYGSVTWGPAGGLYCVTDEGRDTLALARIDPDARTVETVLEGGAYNVDGVAVEEDSGLLVYSRNVDGYTELTVGEAAGPTAVETIGRPALPGGVAGGVSFGPDGERFALSASGRTVNTNVYTVDVTSLRDAADAAEGRRAPGDGEYRSAGPVERWTEAATAGIPRETFAEPDLVRYESFDGLEVPALFSLPADAAGAERGGVPVIVDIHGGPESQRRPSFSGLTQYFLSRGYAVFEPNVRGSTGYGKSYTRLDDVEKRMDAVRDIGAALDWLAERPAVDSDRIVAKGGSYGGFMVLAALVEFPDRFAAGVDSVGIANFVTFLENTGPWRRELREAEYGSLEEDRELLERISPINRAEEIEAPLFVLHGANDPRVPVSEAEQIAETVRAAGVPVEKLIFEDEGHGIAKLDNRIEAYGRVVEFLYEHV